MEIKFDEQQEYKLAAKYWQTWIMLEHGFWLAVEMGVKPEDDMWSWIVFLGFSSTPDWKDKNWGMAETLFEKDHCIAEPLIGTVKPKENGYELCLFNHNVSFDIQFLFQKKKFHLSDYILW